MKKSFWIVLMLVAILALVPLAHALVSNGGLGSGENGKAFGIDGRPENTRGGFLAACLALCLALFLLPVWLLKWLHRTRQVTGGTIPFLPFSASFHLAGSGETIGRGKSVVARERDGGLTFRPFSFP